MLPTRQNHFGGRNHRDPAAGRRPPPQKLHDQQRQKTSAEQRVDRSIGGVRAGRGGAVMPGRPRRAASKTQGWESSDGQEMRAATVYPVMFCVNVAGSLPRAATRLVAADRTFYTPPAFIPSRSQKRHEWIRAVSHRSRRRRRCGIRFVVVSLRAIEDRFPDHSKLSPTFTETYVDVRPFTAVDWQQRKAHAAVLRANQERSSAKESSTKPPRLPAAGCRSFRKPGRFPTALITAPGRDPLCNTPNWATHPAGCAPLPGRG